MTTAVPNLPAPARAEPLPHQEYAILRGLICSRPACRWIEAMGIDFDRLFTDRRARCLAVWAVGRDARAADRDSPAMRALTATRPGHASIGEWLAADLDPMGGKFDPAWGDADVQGFCRELHPRWLGTALRGAAEDATKQGWAPDAVTRDCLKDAENQNDHGIALLAEMAGDDGIPQDIREHLAKVLAYIEGAP